METLQAVKNAIHRGTSVTREQLSQLPIKTLQGLDIRTPEQEKLVQEVLNSKRTALPISQDIHAIARQGIRTDSLKSPEDEAKAQAIINKRLAKLRPTVALNPEPEATPETPVVTPEVSMEVKAKKARPTKAI